MKHIVFPCTNVLQKLYLWQFIQGRSQLSKIVTLLGTKFDIVFMFVLVKIETCSLTSKFVSADS